MTIDDIKRLAREGNEKRSFRDTRRSVKRGNY